MGCKTTANKGKGTRDSPLSPAPSWLGRFKKSGRGSKSCPHFAWPGRKEKRGVSLFFSPERAGERKKGGREQANLAGKETPPWGKERRGEGEQGAP